MVTFSLNCNVGKMSQIQSLQFTGSFVACLAFALDTILQPWLAHCSIKAVEYVDEPDHALSQFYIKHQLRFTDLSSELRTFFSTWTEYVGFSCICRRSNPVLGKEWPERIMRRATFFWIIRDTFSLTASFSQLRKMYTCLAQQLAWSYIKIEVSQDLKKNSFSKRWPPSFAEHDQTEINLRYNRSTFYLMPCDHTYHTLAFHKKRNNDNN